MKKEEKQIKRTLPQALLDKHKAKSIFIGYDKIGYAYMQLPDLILDRAGNKWHIKVEMSSVQTDNEELLHSILERVRS